MIKRIDQVKLQPPMHTTLLLAKVPYLLVHRDAACYVEPFLISLVLLQCCNFYQAGEPVIESDESDHFPGKGSTP